MIIQNINSFYELIINNKWLLLASFFSALTIILVRYYLKYNNKIILLLTFLFDMGLIYSYVQLLQQCDILTSFLLVKIISIIIVLVPSIMFWDVKLTNQKFIGLILAFIAIYLLK
jgi:hypothetical protein